MVWCPAGVTHWHGADQGSFMVHEAVSFGGIEWYEEVEGGSGEGNMKEEK
jgi:quercetin dioxygenase-like cupin family protein